ncbi:hypothetical protein NK8_75670 (plasmid) [Caballeronia sp. NK8]|nr:hypothetical protein NK8_75670 [Caballeronia sp. NK8]
MLEAGSGALAAGEDAPLAGTVAVLFAAGGLVVIFVVPVSEAGVSVAGTLTADADALPLRVAFADDAVSPPPPPPPPHAASNTLAAAASAMVLNRI